MGKIIETKYNDLGNAASFHDISGPVESHVVQNSSKIVLSFCRTDALDDNTKLVRVPKWYLLDMYFWDEIAKQKIKFINKLKKLIKRRKVRKYKEGQE